MRRVLLKELIIHMSRHLLKSLGEYKLFHLQPPYNTPVGQNYGVLSRPAKTSLNFTTANKKSEVATQYLKKIGSYYK